MLPVGKGAGMRNQFGNKRGLAINVDKRKRTLRGCVLFLLEL
jgi:hypothetical protein